MLKASGPLILLTLVYSHLFAFAQNHCGDSKAMEAGGSSLMDNQNRPIYQDFPHISLGNDLLNVVVVLPDKAKGFYRGTRFDWSGMAAEININNHSFVEQWYFPHTPEQNNNGIGTAEEFLLPLAYEEAQPGEVFIKIGVGLIEKTVDEKYSSNLPYAIKDGGEWTISNGKDWIEFQHRIPSVNGYAYHYIKKIELLQNQAVFVVKRRLINSGTKTILSQHYGHNFFQIDKERIDEQYRLRFPFPVRTDNDFSGRADVQDRIIAMTKKLDRKEAFGATLTGYDQSALSHHIVLENTNTRAAIKIEGDKPLSKLYLYVVDTAICPEPYVDISIDPGKEFRWETRYSFYEF